MSNDNAVIVEVMRNSDGLVRTVAAPADDVYMWEFGNYSCDCNRHGLFECAGGDQDPDFGDCNDSEAGEGLYSARVTSNGAFVYSDGKFRAAA